MQISNQTCKRLALRKSTHVCVRHNVRVAAAQLHLLVFAALNAARRKAVQFVHLNVIFFRKTAIPLLDAYITRFRIVFDIFHRQLPPGELTAQKIAQNCHRNKLIVDELVDL